RVTKHSRDRKFVHIAIPTKKLQATVDDFSLQVGQPILGHGGGNRIERAGKVAFDAMVVKHPCDCRLRLALGKSELGILEFDELLAESLSLLDVFNGDGKRQFEHGLGMYRNDEALARKIVHQLCEPLAFVPAEQALRRQFHVLEEQLRSVGGVEAKLLELPAAAEARRILGFH